MAPFHSHFVLYADKSEKNRVLTTTSLKVFNYFVFLFNMWMDDHVWLSWLHQRYKIVDMTDCRSSITISHIMIASQKSKI